MYYLCNSSILDEKYLIEGFNKLKNSNAKNAFSCTSMPFPIQRTFKITSDERCEMFWPENFIIKNENLSAIALSKKLEIPLRTTQRWIKELKDKNKIEYRGSKKTGGILQNS